MNGGSFLLTIVTPTRTFERKITDIRLKDATAYFGIMRGHADFITVAEPCLAYYHDSKGKETFLAVDRGMLSVRRGTVTLTSRDVYENDGAEGLADIIEGAIAKREEAERGLFSMLEGIERLFIEKTIEHLK